jgi:ligand-binding sensor domain-containing protein/two-component sensor histidine kinase
MSRNLFYAHYVRYQPATFWVTFFSLVVSLLVSLFIPLQLFAKPEQLRFQHWTSEIGLAHNTCNALLEDANGFLWIGTPNGLNRFDGSRFETYRTGSLNAKGLQNHFIHTIYEDRQHRLWVGTNDALYQYDGLAFQRFTPDSLRSVEITVISEDARGHFWLGTSKGLYTFDDAAHTFLKVPYITPHTAESREADNTIRSLCHTGDTLWIGSGKGLDWVDTRLYTAMSLGCKCGDPSCLIDNAVYTFHLDKRRHVWIGSRQGLYRYDPDAGRFISYLPEPHTHTIPSANTILDIDETPDGSLWLATADGLYQSESSHEQFYKHQHSLTDLHSLSDNRLHTLHFGRSGLLWVGTAYHGLNAYHFGANLFSTYVAAPKPISAGENYVFSLWEHSDSLIWVGSASGGLTLFNRTTGEAKRIFHDPRQRQSLSHNSVWAIHETIDGTLWVGTADGLNKTKVHTAVSDAQHNHTPSFTVFKHRSGDPTSLIGNAIRAIYEDRYRTLWFATNHGLCYWDASAQSFVSVRLQTPERAIANDSLIQTLYADRCGTLWIGARRGLYKLAIGDTLATRIALPPAYFQSENIQSIGEDLCGRLWLGTDAGLVMTTCDQNRFEVFRQEQGLSNTFVYGILPDSELRFWLSTNEGLFRFNTVSRGFERFTVSDGLQAMEFNSNAYHRGKSGQFYFGGVNGFSVFHPDSVRLMQTTPHVVIDKFKVFDNELRVTAKPVSLQHGDNFFSFEFVAPTFSHSADIQYWYKLDGFDTDWIQAGTRRYAGYTNVPPGNYRFLVKAAFAHLAGSPAVIALPSTTDMRFSIAPPFWKTWYFITLISGVVVFTILTILRLVFQQQLHKELIRIEKERVLAKERERISADLHDEVGASLTEIAFLGEQAKAYSTRNDTMNQLVERIAERSREAIDNIGSIIWTTNPQNDRLDTLVMYLREYANEYLEAVGIEYHYAGTPAFPPVPLAADGRRNIFLIVKESLANIVKHANATSVALSIHFDNICLSITIDDNGNGCPITRKATSHHGNGLLNMEKRALAMGGTITILSPSSGGTKIQLVIPIRTMPVD